MTATRTFEPSSTEELSAIVRETAAENLALAPVGSGTMLGLGNAPSRSDVSLKTNALDRIVEYAPEDQVVVVEAGMKLKALQAELAQHGQRLAIDPPYGDEMTIGGMIATNAYGPSALRYGTLKDLIVGIEIVRADGAVARAGGKVVKNVAGFDVSKLMVGALGTLAIVTKATFRLHPLPESSRTLTFEAPLAQVFPFVLALREAQLEPSAVLASIKGSRAALEVGFEGFGPGVDAQSDRCAAIAKEMGLSECASPVVIPSGVEGQRKYRLKATFPPADFERVAAEVDDAVAYPSLGVMHFGGPSTSLGMTEELRTMLESLGGTLVVQDMSDAWSGKIDAWGTPPPAFKLMQALKERFDPQRRLNPGRFVGGL